MFLKTINLDFLALIVPQIEPQPKKRLINTLSHFIHSLNVLSHLWPGYSCH